MPDVFGTAAHTPCPTVEARAHSAKNWQMMLAALKKYVED